MQDNLHPPIIVAVSVAHRDFVIRAHVADLGGVALLVLDVVVRAGEGHVLHGLNVDGVVGAGNGDLGECAAVNVVVGTVDDDHGGARGHGHVLVGLVDGQGARGVLGGGRGSSRGGLGGGY